MIRHAGRREADYSSTAMDEQQKFADLQVLSRMAARLGGRDPDEYITVRIGEVVAFNDVVGRYPDFTKRAEAAYNLLRESVEF